MNVSLNALPLSLSSPATAVFSNVVPGTVQGASGDLAGGGVFFSGNIEALGHWEADIHRTVLANLNAYSNVAIWGENIASCESSFAVLPRAHVVCIFFLSWQPRERG